MSTLTQPGLQGVACVPFAPAGLLNVARAPRVGGAFSPPQSSHLKIWLKSDTLGTNGSPILTWADQSGNGNDATKYASFSAATVNASGTNGLPEASFDGATQALYCNAPAATYPTFTFLVVYRIVGASAAFGLNPEQAARVFGCFNDQACINVANDSGGSTCGRSFDGAGNPVVQIATPVGSSYLMSLRLDGTTLRLQSNNHAPVTAASGPLSGSPDNYFMGVDTWQAHWFQGGISEVAVYDLDIGATDLATWVAYLAAKYNVTT